MEALLVIKLLVHVGFPPKPTCEPSSTTLAYSSNADTRTMPVPIVDMWGYKTVVCSLGAQIMKIVAQKCPQDS